MKRLLFVIIIFLLFFTSKSSANHDTIEFDGWRSSGGYNSPAIRIYNKNSPYVMPQNYKWEVTFEDGKSRIYKTHGEPCLALKECTWFIRFNKKRYPKTIGLRHK